MTDLLGYLLLAFGTFLISMSAFYAAWIETRVAILRQSLFEVRDHLWREARQLDALDDPAYRAARSHLHSLMRSAGWYSVAILDYAYRASKHKPVEWDMPQSENPDMQFAIDRAFDDATQLICRHALYHRLSGWAYRFGLRSLAGADTDRRVSRRTATRRAERVARGWVRSRSPEQAVRCEQEIENAVGAAC